MSYREERINLRNLLLEKICINNHKRMYLKLKISRNLKIGRMLILENNHKILCQIKRIINSLRVTIKIIMK